MTDVVRSRFEVTPIDAATLSVTLRLPADLDVRAVHVVGEFNEWDQEATPMHLEGNDRVAVLVLVAGRRYRFRYLLDGARWVNDWRADDYVPNDYGGYDSVIDLTALR